MIFVLAYLLVTIEERTGLRKSKPVLLAAGLISSLVAWTAPTYGIAEREARQAILFSLREEGGPALLLMAAMTYIAALKRLDVFEALRERPIPRS